jgi:hypothetical protein
MRVVWVWTDYAPQPFFAEDFGPDGPRRSNYSFTLTTGYVDVEGIWHLPILGDLRLYNHRALNSEKGQDLGLFQPIDVLFWMLMPPAPPGQKYPRLRARLLPECQGVPAETRA